MARAEAAMQETFKRIQEMARELILIKKAEIRSIAGFGKNTNDQNEKLLHAEASKLLSEVYIQAQTTLAEVETSVQRAQQTVEKIQNIHKDMESMVKAGNVHAESRTVIETNCNF